MIELPDFGKSFDYENNFYLSCGNTRLSKFIVHYELFGLTNGLGGNIVECGIFKGTSFVRFAGFRDLLGGCFSRKLIGFDTFDAFPDANNEYDKTDRDNFVKVAGAQSISKKQLIRVLDKKGIGENVELVEGDIVSTVPDYVKKNPQLKISLLNLDVDIYEPTVTILKHLYPHIVPGGVLILDDYGKFYGETKAIDEYFDGKDITILKFPFAMSQCYIVK